MSYFTRVCALIATTGLSLLSARSSGQVTFSSQTYALKNPASLMVSGDFNGDGRPDLAVLSLTGGTVSILLANADGTFSAATDFPAITPPGGSFQGIAVGDVNGDGKLDLIVGDALNAAGPSVNVLLGNGDGTFQPAVVTVLNFLVQADTFVGVADMNGDKKLDVVIFGYDGKTAIGPLALLGKGDGTFTPSTVTPVGFEPSGAVVADVNGDGKPDLVATNVDVSGFVLDVFLGDGMGNFKSPVSEPGAGAGIAVSDFNHDGKIDLTLFASQGEECEFRVCHPVGPPGVLAVLLGAGDGTFGGPGVLASDNYPLALVGDFDGDGNLDVAAFGSSPTPSVVMLGNGLGSFPNQVALSVGGLISADFNGDGLADLAQPSGAGVQVNLNTTPNFTLSAASSSSTVSAGGSATYTINVGQQNGFSSSVTLVCSIQAAGSSCSLSPSKAAPGISAKLTVTTTAMSSRLAPRWSGWFYVLWLPFGAIVFGEISGTKTKKQRVAGLMLICLLGLGMIIQLACGGGGTSSSTGTLPGNYSITITGTSGSLQRSTMVSLTVH